MPIPARTMPAVSWREFAAAYEAAHQDPVNRCVHHATHLGAALVLGALPVNWASHGIFERNRHL